MLLLVLVLLVLLVLGQLLVLLVLLLGQRRLGGRGGVGGDGDGLVDGGGLSLDLLLELLGRKVVVGGRSWEVHGLLGLWAGCGLFFRVSLIAPRSSHSMVGRGWRLR